MQVTLESFCQPHPAPALLGESTKGQLDMSLWMAKGHVVREGNRGQRIFVQNKDDSPGLVMWYLSC